MKYTWEFFSRRRNLEISKFLRGTKTLEEAKKKFLENQIIPPDDASILSAIVKDSPLTKAMNKRSTSKTSDAAPAKDQKDVVSTSQKKTTSKKSKQKKYFRKVLSPKSGEPDE